MQKYIPSQQNYIQNNFSNIVSILFKSIEITVRQFVLKVILQSRGIVRWGCPNTPFRYGRCIQAVIVFHWFFLQPTQRASLYYFRGICTMISSASFLLSWFAYFLKIVRNTFLVPNEFAIAGETAINNGPKFCTKKVYL